MTNKELIELRDSLETWLTFVRPHGESHPLVMASEYTYAFVNATLKHQGATD